MRKNIKKYSLWSIIALFICLPISVCATTGSGGGSGDASGGGGTGDAYPATTQLSTAGFRIYLIVDDKKVAYRDYMSPNNELKNIAGADGLYQGRKFYYMKGLTRSELVQKKSLQPNDFVETKSDLERTVFAKKAINNFNKLSTFFPEIRNWSSQNQSVLGYAGISNALIWDENDKIKDALMVRQYTKYVQDEFGEELKENCDNKSAIFLLIEPMVSILNRPTGNMRYVTATGVAYLGKDFSGFSNIGGTWEYRKAMWTPKTIFRDSNGKIVKYNPLEGVGNQSGTLATYEQMLYEHRAWGMNIVWIKSEACPKPVCYDMNVTSDGIAKCEKTNQTNDSSYRETTGTERVCEETEDSKESSKYGTRQKSINENCNIYCLETGITKFPGNIMPAKTVGTHFTWPSINFEGHSLTFEGTKTCHYIVDDRATDAQLKQCANYKPTLKELYGDFQAGATMSYNDPQYGREIPLEKYKEESNCSNCSSAGTTNIGSLNKRVVKLNRKVSFKIKDSVYRYVDKNGISKYNPPSDTSKYTNIGYGNLPISMNAILAKKYSLSLYDIKFGSDNQFGKYINGKVKKYTCTYEATKLKNTCVCPPGTKYSGKDLLPFIVEHGPMTCATAQIEQAKYNYCDTPPTPVERYCPNKPEVSIEACLIAGNSKDSCIKRYCEGPPPEYECPKNGTDGFTEYMDITDCVETKIKQGYTEAEAIKVCQDVVCPKDAEKIIYRTIDLETPFPSKNLNGKVPWSNSNFTKGRYPGYNWNSEELVKTKILNNRGVKGKEVYNKEPLYIIDLTPKMIKEIKSYNKTTSYADNKMNCAEDGTACASTFLRSKYAGLVTGGTCRNASRNNFYKCVE